MNYQSTDAFVGGFARGFGLVNSAIDAKENRQYRKEMMGMQKEFYDRKIQREDMNNKVNALRALLLIKTATSATLAVMAKVQATLSNT